LKLIEMLVGRVRDSRGCQKKRRASSPRGSDEAINPAEGSLSELGGWFYDHPLKNLAGISPSLPRKFWELTAGVGKSYISQIGIGQ